MQNFNLIIRRYQTNPNQETSCETTNQYSASAKVIKRRIATQIGGGLGDRTKVNVGCQIQFHNRKIPMLVEKLVKPG